MRLRTAASDPRRDDRRLEGHGHRRDRRGDECRGALGRQLARTEPNAAEPRRVEPVEPECSPVFAAHVPADEVPAPAGGNEIVRFDEALGLVAVAAAIVEADLLVVATRQREHGQRVAHRRSRCRRPTASTTRWCAPRSRGGATDRGGPVRAWRARARTFPRCPRSTRRPRREGRPRWRPPRRRRAAGEAGARRPRAGTRRCAGCRVDRIAQLPEPVDVAAQRSRADLELRGQLFARPELVRLQQGEQAQRPSRRIRHSSIFPHIAVRI